MDIPLYSLEGGLGAMGNMQKAIEAQIIKNLSDNLDRAGITEVGTSVPLTTDLAAGETGFGSLGRFKLGRRLGGFWKRLRGKRKRKAVKAKSNLAKASRQLIDTRLAEKKAATVETLAAKRGDPAAQSQAARAKAALGIRRKALQKAQRVFASQTTAPVLKKSEVLREAMPEIRKAAASIAAGIRSQARQVKAISKRRAAVSRRRRKPAGYARGAPKRNPFTGKIMLPPKSASPFDLRGLGSLPAPTVTPYDIELPRASEPFDELQYPEKGLDYGLAQFKVVEDHERDIGSFFEPIPPFSESEFDYPATEAEWSKKYESEEVSDMFPVGFGADASESSGSDSWSPVVDTFPGWRERRWDFDENVIAQRAPTAGNVKRLVAGGVRAAMRTIDQTGDVAQMNANLKKFGIKPKPKGQPFTTAGNEAYKQIVGGLTKAKIISTARGRPADVKVKPAKFRKVLDAGLTKERQLRNKRRRYLRWLGR